MPYNVLSLFGGCDSGYRYLLDAGHEVGKYYSAEVDKYAVKVAKANFPDIVELGDACQVGVSTIVDPVSTCGTVHFLRCSWGEIVVPGKIDILMGGPPCQNYSRAGNRKGIDGETGRLVLEFLRVFDESSPRWFFMENVPGMPEETQAMVSSRLGVPVRRIRASLLSSQNRDRLVWTNIPFEEPEDSGRVLLDDLEDVPLDAVDSKGKPLWKPLPEKFLPDVLARLSKLDPSKPFCVNSKVDGKQPSLSDRIYHPAAKSPCLTTSFHPNVLGCFTRSRGKQNSAFSPEKTPTVTSSSFIYNSFLIGQFRRSKLRIHADQDRSPTLTANMGTGGKNVPVVLVPDSDYQLFYRHFTVTECARIQGLEAFDFSSVSKSQALKIIGNSWPRYVCHIFKFLPA